MSNNRNQTSEHLTKFKDIEFDSNKPKTILQKIKSLNRVSSSDTIISSNNHFFVCCFYIEI